MLKYGIITRFSKFFKNLGSKHLHTIANKRRCCAHTPKPKLDIVLNVFRASKTGKRGATHIHNQRVLKTHLMSIFKILSPKMNQLVQYIIYAHYQLNRYINESLSRKFITIHVDKICDHSRLNTLSQTTHNLILSKKLKSKK